MLLGKTGLHPLALSPLVRQAIPAMKVILGLADIVTGSIKSKGSLITFEDMRQHSQPF